MNRIPRNKTELQPALVFMSGELMAVPIPLERETVTLGRSLEADVRVNDPKASRLHAKIQIIRDAQTGEPRCQIFDLNSRNGTLVNGQPITNAVLHPNDKICIGNQFLRFEVLDEIDREFQMQIYRLISHDELTGLLSSRSFFYEMRREAGKAALENRPFCVLMLDLDFFKRVNDRFGHVTGSKTLEETSLCISRSLRAGDVASRFGGEEFAVFLLNADLKAGEIAAERIRAAIEIFDFTVTRPLEDGAPKTHKITTSIGLATFPEDSSDPIELVEMADAALYRAKQTGRNRVCVYRQTKQAEVTEKLSQLQPSAS